jgi:hypothetical protein
MTVAYDINAQRSGHIAGFGMIEGGYFDISSASQTVDVATRLSNATLGIAIARTNDPDKQGLIATTDGDITNGTITWRRQTTYLPEDLRCYYVLMGW